MSGESRAAAKWCIICALSCDSLRQGRRISQHIG